MGKVFLLAWAISATGQKNMALAEELVPHFQREIPARRIRRELRSLRPEARERVFIAMDIMKNTSTRAGRARYGGRFTSYDDIVARHLAAAACPRCLDCAHLGPGFLLITELSLSP